jgi:sulfoxide reductase heme-binding subunit YedZ
MTPNTHIWWYLSRSSGIVAWALLATSVLWGLMLSTRLFGKRPTPRWLTDLHRFLGGLALLFTGLHMATLVADSYVNFGAKELLVPFASGWRAVAVAWGVISFWVLVAIEVTSLAMRHLPRRIWHAVHLSSFALFVTATVHAFTAGTDTRSQLFMVMCAALTAVVALLTLVRLMTPRQRSDARERSIAAARARVTAESA